MKKVNKFIFYTPPSQNHCFWGSMRAKMEGKRDLETIFRVLDVNNTYQCTFSRNSRRQGVGQGQPPNKLGGAGLDKTPRIGFRSIGVHKSRHRVSRAPYIIY